jgi:uncharacterized protein (TIGR00255 family)
VIKSMTGFASLTRDESSATIAVTVRSVNHRYLDMQLRLPPGVAEQEQRLRALVQSRLSRGRIELSLTVQLRRSPQVEVELNEPFVAALAAALDIARERGHVEGALTTGDLLRFPQALTVREKAVETEDGLAGAIHDAVEEALDRLETMRVREGEHLRIDLEGRRAVLGQLIDQIESAADQGQAAFEARLSKRISELTLEVAADPVTIAQEVVRAAARGDISEEVVRFRGHLLHWTELAQGAEPCGRKLDFLLQEMHREINTIGAKAEGARVTELVVSAKAELEKMREQAQNVE